MRKLNAERLFKPYEQATAFHQMLANFPDGKFLYVLPIDHTGLVEQLGRLVDELTDLEMITSAMPVARAIDLLKTAYLDNESSPSQMVLEPPTWRRIQNDLAQATSRIADDFTATSLLALAPSMKRYFENPKLFGDAVFNSFPSAVNDITEAGSCLALGRATASVMHSMRVVEVGLKTLAGAVGVGSQDNWGAYLREIDRALEARAKAAGKRSADELFYAEARVTLDGVRLAWRNPTMHIENSYSPDRAEDILIAVRTLMRHLATRIFERGSLAELLS